MIGAELILAVGLRSPSADLVARIIAAPASIQCKAVQSVGRNVIGVTYYRPNTNSSITDPEKLKQNEANLKPYRDYLQAVADESDAAARGDANAAACGLHALAAWANGNGMLGNINKQGEYEREWTTGGLALAYLKIRDTGIANPQGDRIGQWFASLARAIEPYYPPGGPSNNHAYWAGVAVAASGIAANDRSLYDWGIATYSLGVDQIAPDGTLPQEMARKERALHYHLFAIEPLVMLAEMGRANGSDLYAMRDHAIARLAQRCADGIKDPSYFTQKSGVAQDIRAGAKLRIDEIAWIVPYVARFPNAAMSAIVRGYTPVIYSRLGGNLTALYQDARAAFDPLPAADVVTTMQRAADWQLAHLNDHRLSTDWTHGVLDAGVMALAGVSANNKYRDAMVHMGNANNWQPGKRLYFADDHVITQTYLELHSRYHDAAMLKPTRATFDAIVAHPAPGATNLAFNPNRRDKWTWCDALFMAPASFAELSAQTGDQKYFDDMDLRFWRTVAYLYDRKEHLFYRDSTYFGQRERNGQPVFWARGNGWVLGGIARVLQAMPQNHPERPKYVALFRELSERLAGLQSSDGAWRASLLDPQTYREPEMSSTALITYGLAWGVNAGVLDAAAYAPRVRNAWGALASHVDTSGRLGSVQPIGKSPEHTSPSSSAPYGTGALLLAGSEVYKMQLLAQTSHVNVTVTNPLPTRRMSETLEVSGDTLRAAFPKAPLDNFMRDFIVLDGTRGAVIDSQVTYAAAGATHDTLIFQTDLAPTETQHFIIMQRPASIATPNPIVKTFARFVPERQDDFAWENDRMAYRVFGPALIKGEGTNTSGIKVWLKSVRYPIIDGWYRRMDYHADHGEGVDYNDVGSSRGFGGSGVWNGSTYFPPPNYTTWQLVSSGPIRAEFILTYGPWDAGGRAISETKRVTLDAGSNMVRVDETWISNDAKPIDVGIAEVVNEWPPRRVHSKTVVNLARTDHAPPDPQANMEVSPSGEWIEDWQQNGTPPRSASPAGATAIAAYVPLTASPHVGYAEGHVLLNARAQSGSPFTYFFGAGWSKFDFTNQAAWRSYVLDFAARYSHPLSVKLDP